jgi:hypothetical protein
MSITLPRRRLGYALPPPTSHDDRGLTAASVFAYSTCAIAAAIVVSPGLKE